MCNCWCKLHLLGLPAFPAVDVIAVWVNKDVRGALDTWSSCLLLPLVVVCVNLTAELIWMGCSEQSDWLTDWSIGQLYFFVLASMARQINSQLDGFILALLYLDDSWSSCSIAATNYYVAIIMVKGCILHGGLVVSMVPDPPPQNPPCTSPWWRGWTVK